MTKTTESKVWRAARQAKMYARKLRGFSLGNEPAFQLIHQDRKGVCMPLEGVYTAKEVIEGCARIKKEKDVMASFILHIAENLPQ
jgi:hypothetical protein